MRATIHSYLTFNGNCREAMVFYKECFGGTLTFHTVGDSPFGGKMPRQIKDCILHSSLKNGGITLLGTDMIPEPGLSKGNSVSLLLECSSEEQIREFYSKLSVGGKATHPIEPTFWGALFGGVTDKFGNNWLLNYIEVQKRE